jgi:hypothetical protein
MDMQSKSRQTVKDDLFKQTICPLGPLWSTLGCCASRSNLGPLSLSSSFPPLLGALLALPTKARILCLNSLESIVA